tara:strand:+ start:85 stop:744 length:660 start_codon:yes stop_codon:yes gene_type:complete
MIIILKEPNQSKKNHYSKSFEELEKFINKINPKKNLLLATIYLFDSSLTCDELLRMKKNFLNSNIPIKAFITNSRESLISAKFLKINAFFRWREPIIPAHEEQTNGLSTDYTHVGMVRSGDKISSNGNLIIIGDVNPGAQISAKKNIYVWGKLCGVAIAGNKGDENCKIASLYLNPLQLRINSTVAIGPKEKPVNHYPEIASLEDGRIVINPLLVNNLE